MCADPYSTLGDEYVGHDEPSVLFKSDVPGSGNDVTYVIVPDGPERAADRVRRRWRTWNFQLRPTFWFGMTLCDTESAPDFTKTCTPDSDANDLVGTNPAAADYIGKHPGNAYMELQFYGPGYVPQFEGFGCTATQYCAAMTIDSLTLRTRTPGSRTTRPATTTSSAEPSRSTGRTSRRTACPRRPPTRCSPGRSRARTSPRSIPTTPKDLMMNPGDRIRIHMHDTAAGFRVDLIDLTTGQSGSMTASVANGFGHILYQPTSTTCHMAPYAFHPEYSTGNPRGNTWSAHTYNVAFSDEIGHFENCLKIDANFNCAKPGSQDKGSLDPDDGNNFCVPGTDSLAVKINGCFTATVIGMHSPTSWTGREPTRTSRQDQALHPSPVLFTSAITNNGSTNYSTVAFEADLPRIEASDSQDNPPFCDRTTGENCVNPPNGAQFYPFYSTRSRTAAAHGRRAGRSSPARPTISVEARPPSTARC